MLGFSVKCSNLFFIMECITKMKYSDLIPNECTQFLFVLYNFYYAKRMLMNKVVFY